MKKLTLTLFFILTLTLTAQSREYTSLEQIAEDPAVLRDFNFQGEYADEDEDNPYGLNIIAEGDGKFKFVGFKGSLPGDGWKKGDRRIFGTLTFKNDTMLDYVLEYVEENGEREKMDLPFTPILEDGKLRFADSQTLYRRIERKSPTLGQKAPEGAVIIFDGESEGHLANGDKNEEAGTMWSEFTSKPLARKPYLLHVEFLLSYMPNDRGQGRSNSGVYLDEAFEVQVLDSFGLEGENNECGGIYSHCAPKLNMCYPPLQWQTYDIEFEPPLYDADGNITSPGKFRTVKHNGVVVQENFEITEGTPSGRPAAAEPRGVYFQGHGNKVQYRNIWAEYID